MTTNWENMSAKERMESAIDAIRCGECLHLENTLSPLVVDAETGRMFTAFMAELGLVFNPTLKKAMAPDKSVAYDSQVNTAHYISIYNAHQIVTGCN